MAFVTCTPLATSVFRSSFPLGSRCGSTLRARTNRFNNSIRMVAMAAATGTKIPLEKKAFVLSEGKPTPISLSDVFAGKKVVMITIPGALTPTCTDSHAPGFLEKLAELKEKGVDDVVCLSVNDPFVMDAYAKKMNAVEKMKFLGDGDASITKALGLEVDTGGFGGVRAKRGSYIVDDGVFTNVNVEPDGTGFAGPSKVETILSQL